MKYKKLALKKEENSFEMVDLFFAKKNLPKPKNQNIFIYLELFKKWTD